MALAAQLALLSPGIECSAAMGKALVPRGKSPVRNAWAPTKRGWTNSARTLKNAALRAGAFLPRPRTDASRKTKGNEPAERPEDILDGPAQGQEEGGFSPETALRRIQDDLDPELARAADPGSSSAETSLEGSESVILRLQRPLEDETPSPAGSPEIALGPVSEASQGQGASSLRRPEEATERRYAPPEPALLASAAGVAMHHAPEAGAGSISMAGLMEKLSSYPLSTWLEIGGIIGGAVLANYLLQKWVETALKSRNKDKLLQEFAAKALRFGVILGAGVAITLNLGMPSEKLSQLGIVGMAAAPTLHELVENLPGTVWLAMEQPFKIGDRIQVGEFEASRGIVTKVTLQKTFLEDGNGNELEIHNKRFANEPVLLLKPVRKKKGPARAEEPRPQASRWPTWLAATAATLMPAAWLAAQLWTGTAAAWLAALAIAGSSWILGAALHAYMRRRSTGEPVLDSIKARLFVYGVYALAGLAILKLVFGLSLLGHMWDMSLIILALGFALKATLKSLIIGLKLLWDEAYGIGDPIKAGPSGTVRGKVDRITLSRTELISSSKNLRGRWLIPNSLITAGDLSSPKAKDE